MNISTIILGAAALYLISDTKSANKQLQSQLDSVATDFSNYKKDQATKEELEQIEKDAAAAAADVSKKCFPVGFFGVIGNYYTSDKYISANWYVKFQNVSNDEITVNLESLSVTILNSKQIRHQSDLLRKNITVKPKSVSGWILVASYQDDILYGYSTVGREIMDNFPEHRYSYWYAADATFKYSLSNPYVNNGLSVDVKDVTIDGGVYGIRIWDDGWVMNKVPEFSKWADFGIEASEWYAKQFKEQFGTDDMYKIGEMITSDSGALRKYIKLISKEPPLSVPSVSGITDNYYWLQMV